MMYKHRIVVDVPVFVTAFHDRTDPAFEMMQLVADGKVEAVVSQPLYHEYTRALIMGAPVHKDRKIGPQEVQTIMKGFAALALPAAPAALVIPGVSDPQCALVMETAISGGAEAIVTGRSKRFGGAKFEFSPRLIAPRLLAKEFSL